MTEDSASEPRSNEFIRGHQPVPDKKRSPVKVGLKRRLVQMEQAPLPKGCFADPCRRSIQGGNRTHGYILDHSIVASVTNPALNAIDA